MLRIPLSPQPDFSFRLVLDTYVVDFRFLWAAETEQWFVDLDCEELGLAAHGLALVTGRGLLMGHSIRELGELILKDRTGDEDPDYDGLGDRWVLYYVTRGEYDAI